MFLFSGIAMAGGGGHGDAHGAPWAKIIFHAINFSLLVGGLAFVARKPLKTALLARTAKIRDELELAQRLQAEAEARNAELQAQLDGLQTRLDEMAAEAELAAQAEQEALKERAKRDAALISESAQRTIRDEAERAKVALRQEAARLAVELAAKRLRDQVTDTDQKKLTDQFITAVQDSQSGVDHG